MARLDEQTRRDLERLREHASPSAAAKQRMFAGLELRLGGGGGDPDDSGGGDAGGDLGGDLASIEAPLAADGGLGGIVWAAKVVGATLTMTAAGVIALQLGVGAVRMLKAQPSSHGDASQSRPALAQSIEQDSAHEHESEPSELDSFTPPVQAEPAQPPTRPRPKPGDARADAPAATPQDTLAAELALLEAAHTSDPRSALAALEQHLAEFPHGELADERELLRVQTLCRLDRLDEARDLATAFLQQHPNSALRKRLLSTCPALTGMDAPQAGHSDMP